MSSIFTKIIQGEIPCYKVAENEKFFAFLDINPLQKGHTLVVPKLEIDHFFDLKDELLSDLILFSKKVASAIEKSVECDRVGLAVMGLEVPHAHIHLIPIVKMDDMNFANPKLKFEASEMEEIAKNIFNKF